MLLWLTIEWILLALLLLWRQQQQAKIGLLNEQQREIYSKITRSHALFIFYSVIIWLTTLIAMKFDNRWFFVWLILFIIPALCLSLRNHFQLRKANLPTLLIRNHQQTFILQYITLIILVAIFSYQLPNWQQMSQKLSISDLQSNRIPTKSSVSGKNNTTTTATPVPTKGIHTCPSLAKIIAQRQTATSWPYSGVNWFISYNQTYPIHGDVQGESGFEEAIADIHAGTLRCDYTIMHYKNNKPDGKIIIAVKLDTPYNATIVLGPNWQGKGAKRRCSSSPSGCSFSFKAFTQ